MKRVTLFGKRRVWNEEKMSSVELWLSPWYTFQNLDRGLNQVLSRVFFKSLIKGYLNPLSKFWVWLIFKPRLSSSNYFTKQQNNLLDVIPFVHTDKGPTRPFICSLNRSFVTMTKPWHSNWWTTNLPTSCYHWGMASTPCSWQPKTKKYEFPISLFH